MNRSFRRIAAVIATAGLVFSAVFVMPSAAQAAPNPNIVVSDVVLTGAVGGVVTIGDTLTVTGTWDASEADPHEGDTFTIGLPTELGFDQALPFKLLGGDGTVWAECLTDPITDIATCELTAAVTENPLEVRGAFEFEAEAVATTTAEQVEFNLNGTLTMVDLPGEGGITDGVVIPSDWSKSGTLNSNKWSMTWTIDLPGGGLVGHDVVSIQEELSANHRLCDPSNLKVQTVRGTTVVDVSEIASIAPGVDDQHFVIDLAAPAAGFDSAVTYRVTFDTCTLDKQIDDKGTEYTNEATIDIPGFGSSGVIGVTQDWEVTGQVSKSGRVLGGADRNGVIQWTVTVAGDHLINPDGTPKDSFTLTETLSGQHALCTDGAGEFVVRGLKIDERYGPSETLVRQIGSDLLVPTTTSASAQGFEIDFDVVAGSGFTFKPSKHLYRITYQTCATIDGLPTAGTTFGNSAAVDGTIAGSEARVPGRSESKSGRINTTQVVVGGETNLPQTTLGWTITVPGERLDGVASDLTVTDELTAAHQVCGSGDDISARLGLKFEARDQISGGGLATVDLTDSVTSELDGNTITFTVPQPTLPLPGGGTVTGFSPEYQYVINYTTCTTSGGMDAPGTTYGNSAEVAGITFAQTVTQNNRGSGTGQGVSRGSIAVSKDLADTMGAQFVPAGTVFTVHVKEISPDKSFTHEYDLQVPLDGAPVSGLNARGNGWTVELSEPTFPAVPGVTFGTPVFAGAGVTIGSDGTATVPLTPGTNVTVSLTNSADLGSLEVIKVVDGPASGLVAADREFSVTAQVDVSALGAAFPAQPDRVFTIVQNQPTVLANLPIGSTVSFSETPPADDDTLTWGAAVIDPESIEVLPGHASEPSTITVTNHVERTVGTFSLAKNIVGDEADNPAVPDEVTVNATWNEEGTPGEATLSLPTDGTAVPFGENLLIGTEVTLTEVALVDGSSIAWASPTWSGTGVQIDGDRAVVTIGRDGDARVSLDNHAATSTAGISLLKSIAGEAAGEVDSETEFPVTATWTDDFGVEHSKELFINAVQPTPLGEELPAGTVVTVIEGERPAIATVVWDSITISGSGVEDNGDGSATVIVSDQQDDVTLITVTNEATWAAGTFSLTKNVTGVLLGHPDVPATVTVTASWLDGEGIEQSAELSVPTDGTVVAFGQELAHSTQVTLSEATPEGSQSFTWDTPVWGGDNVAASEDGSAIVTIGAATTAAVSLTNNVTVSLGSIELVKEVTGTADVPANTVYPVTASWTDLMGDVQQRAVEVTVGMPTVIDNLPLGVAVHLTENEAALPDGTRWEGVLWAALSDNVTVEGEGAEAVVTVVGESGSTVSISMTNEIAELPDLDSTDDETPTGDQGPTGDLASTGVNFGPWQLGGIVGVGLSLLVAGAVLILVRRSRRS